MEAPNYEVDLLPPLNQRLKMENSALLVIPVRSRQECHSLPVTFNDPSNNRFRCNEGNGFLGSA